AQASGHNTHIYLLKGLAGIFSTGLGVLDENWSNAVTAPLFPYDFYNPLAEETARLQKSSKGQIIIMGQSLGADAAIYMDEKMKTLKAYVAFVVMLGRKTDLVAPANAGKSR